MQVLFFSKSFSTATKLEDDNETAYLIKMNHYLEHSGDSKP